MVISYQTFRNSGSRGCCNGQQHSSTTISPEKEAKTGTNTHGYEHKYTESHHTQHDGIASEHLEHADDGFADVHYKKDFLPGKEKIIYHSVLLTYCDD